VKAGGIFHANFFYSPRRTLDSSQLTELKVYALAPNGAEWMPGQDLEEANDELLWHGYGRFQPNKDWRARPREVQYEYDAVQAVRIQLPIGKNLLGAVWDVAEERYTSYGADPSFHKDQRVEVISGEVKGFEGTIGTQLYVRNATPNQNLWVHNLLCDVKTGDFLDD
jgi:hypothetical protein